MFHTNLVALELYSWHFVMNDIPDDGVQFVEGKQQNKWLVSSSDLDAMYACFEGKQRISLWCDGRQPPGSECESSDEDGWRSKHKKKDSRKQRKNADDREEELESTFLAA